MYRRSRSISLMALPLLLVVAIAGYLAGHRRVSQPPAAAPVDTTRLASGADVLLEYPSSWQRTTAAPAIPGLALSRELTLSPGGAPDRAGLISGQLAGGEPSPLPASFVHLLHAVPETQLLDFVGGQAYRYSGLTVPGFTPALDLYVVPNPGNGPTAIGCYAAKGASAILAECEQIVAKLTLVGQSQFDLTPDAVYAHKLGAIVRSLDSERLALRRRMRAGADPKAVGALAKTLAVKLEAAAAGLSPLEPPLAAGAAQAVLASSILADRSAYLALASAGAHEDLAAYDVALGRIEHADAEVDSALENFALLGYGRAA